MIQIVINIIETASIYLLVSISFAILYYSSKFFNLFHAFIITISGYLVYLFSIQFQWFWWISIPISLVICGLIGLASYRLVFKPLLERNTGTFLIMIASLGIYIIFQNIVSMIWGDASVSIRFQEIQTGHEIFGAYITTLQIIAIILSIFLFASVSFFLKTTRTGKQMNAIASNTVLCDILGIRSSTIVMISFGIGSLLAAIAGILVAYDTDLSPTMGFNLLFLGIIVIIIAGVLMVYSPF